MTKKRRFTNNEKVNGIMAVRRMTEKAQEFYNGTQPLAVYEYKVDGEERYAYDGGIGYEDNMTFEYVQKDFEDMYDDVMDWLYGEEN